ncbi:MAG: 4Fe-4S binding protein [Candidatus Altiarchaeota archaeon]
MKKYRLTYPTERLGDAVLAEAILAKKTLVNILRANVDYDEGVLVISVMDTPAKERELISYIKSRGVAVEELSGEIVKDSSRCVDCGVCVGVCPTDAISASEDKVILFDNEACVQCGACIEACPFSAVTLRDF